MTRKKEWEKHLTKFWNKLSDQQCITLYHMRGVSERFLDAHFLLRPTTNGTYCTGVSITHNRPIGINQDRSWYSFLIEKKYVSVLDFGEYEEKMIKRNKQWFDLDYKRDVDYDKYWKKVAKKQKSMLRKLTKENTQKKKELEEQYERLGKPTISDMVEQGNSLLEDIKK
jgi:hypothetical protein